MPNLKAGGGILLAPFAIGNAIPGGPSSVEGVHPEMARKIVAMTQAMPPEILARFKISSGYRSPARQVEVYRGSGTPPPMNSRHGAGTGGPGTGRAVDLGNDPVVLDWIGKHPEHGLGFPLRHMGPKEYNHMEMVDSLGGRAPVGGGGAPAARPEFGGGSDAAPVYAQTGDPQFKTGLVTPTSTLDEAPAPDPAKQAALAALALQQVQNSPFGSGGLGGPSSMGDAIAQAVKAGQVPAQPPSTILAGPQYPNPGGPIPLARRIG